MLSPRTSSLFHFTKNLDILQLILAEGFWPQYCLEDQEWINSHHWGFPLVSFCDIPLTRLTDHVNWYGEYGLGMSKNWGEKSNLSPVSYINTNSTQSKAINKVIETCCKVRVKKDQINHALVDCIQMTSFVKPLRGTMKKINGDTLQKEFYSECEWRFVPDLIDFGPLDEDDFKKDAMDLNKDLKKDHMLKFHPNDINYILVKSESEIPKMYDFINTNLGDFSANSIKQLTSRIISLSRLKQDM